MIFRFSLQERQGSEDLSISFRLKMDFRAKPRISGPLESVCIPSFLKTFRFMERLNWKSTLRLKITSSNSMKPVPHGSNN